MDESYEVDVDERMLAQVLALCGCTTLTQPPLKGPRDPQQRVICRPTPCRYDLCLNFWVGDKYVGAYENNQWTVDFDDIYYNIRNAWGVSKKKGLSAKVFLVTPSGEHEVSMSFDPEYLIVRLDGTTNEGWFLRQVKCDPNRWKKFEAELRKRYFNVPIPY